MNAVAMGRRALFAFALPAVLLALRWTLTANSTSFFWPPLSTILQAVDRLRWASTCPPIADGTVASATTDMGHQGKPNGSWVAENPQAKSDFAYPGVNLTAQVAKVVIARFYGKAATHSYFDGCSDGGRQALMEAQRYPPEFDGIAAGAPANNIAVQNTFHHAWNAALSYLRYLADPDHADHQLSDLRFTVKSFWATVAKSSTYMAAPDPDLHAFARGGGCTCSPASRTAAARAPAPSTSSPR